MKKKKRFIPKKTQIFVTLPKGRKRIKVGNYRNQNGINIPILDVINVFIKESGIGTIIFGR